MPVNMTNLCKIFLNIDIFSGSQKKLDYLK